jgi:predicted Zn-dependent protease
MTSDRFRDYVLEDIAADVLSRVADRGDAAVSVQSGHSDLTRFANSFIHQNVAETRIQVALEVVCDDRVASASIDRVDNDSLDRLVERTIHAARLRPIDPDWPGFIEPTPIPTEANWDEVVAGASPAARAERVAEFVGAGADLSAAGFCDTEAFKVLYANTTGHLAEGHFTRTTLDGIHQTSTSAGKAHASSTRWSDIDGQAIGNRAAELARRSENPGHLAAGRYPVILSPECVATMMIFLAFYGFNAKAAFEGQSFFKEGEPQFADSFSLMDDATDPRAIGLLFDNQGAPKQHNLLVDAGVSRSLSHDRRTAARMDTESTGNAVPGSTAFGPVASDLFLAPGTTSQAEMIESTELGVLITEFNYCRILDPKTQVVTGLTRNGTFLVENGEITRPVNNLRFTQSFVEALAPGGIIAVGDDDRFAANEFGPGMTHVPSLQLAAWNFTGDATG